jgi:hypothetical protein
MSLLRPTPPPAIPVRFRRSLWADSPRAWSSRAILAWAALNAAFRGREESAELALEPRLVRRTGRVVVRRGEAAFEMQVQWGDIASHMPADLPALHGARAQDALRGFFESREGLVRGIPVGARVASEVEVRDVEKLLRHVHLAEQELVRRERDTLWAYRAFVEEWSRDLVPGGLPESAIAAVMRRATESPGCGSAVYVVTQVRVDETRVASRRSPGLMSSLENADRLLRTGLEEGEMSGFPFAVVEEVGLDSFHAVSPDRYWYRFDRAAVGYLPCQEPTGFATHSRIGAVG